MKAVMYLFWQLKIHGNIVQYSAHITGITLLNKIVPDLSEHDCTAKYFRVLCIGLKKYQNITMDVSWSLCGTYFCVQ
jgi:hypothetical protein